MAKNYVLNFTGGGNPTLGLGLAPTLIVFKNMGGSNVTAPGITAIPSNLGLYYFTWGPTNTISFVVDGFTTGLGANRYIYGVSDPIDAVDEQLSALGATTLQGMSNLGSSMISMGTSLLAQGASIFAQGVSLLAQGQSIAFGISGLSDLGTLIGTTASSFGNTATDPATVFGYLKRLQEWNEGDSLFTKNTGLWDVYSRGSSTLLAQKALVDDTTTVTKT